MHRLFHTYMEIHRYVTTAGELHTATHSLPRQWMGERIGKKRKNPWVVIKTFNRTEKEGMMIIIIIVVAVIMVIIVTLPKWCKMQLLTSHWLKPGQLLSSSPWPALALFYTLSMVSCGLEYLTLNPNHSNKPPTRKKINSVPAGTRTHVAWATEDGLLVPKPLVSWYLLSCFIWNTSLWPIW